MRLDQRIPYGLQSSMIQYRDGVTTVGRRGKVHAEGLHRRVRSQ
jgi:hypothetical protein